MKSDPVDLVQAWMTAFDVPNDLVLQEKLVTEECIELLEAIVDLKDPTPRVCAEVLKEYADVVFVLAGYIIMMKNLGVESQTKPQTQFLLSSAFDIIADIIAEVPTFDEYAAEVFELVCESNMSKLDDDGKPVRNEDGKVMKGKNYEAPDLQDAGLAFYVDLMDAEEGPQQEAAQAA